MDATGPSRVLQPNPAVCPIYTIRAGVWARGGSTRIRTGNQRPTPHTRSRKKVAERSQGHQKSPLVWGTARTLYECGDRGWGEETTNPEEPPATPDRTPKPQAPEHLSPLIGVGAGHPGPANPAPSARDVWLMRVGGRDLGEGGTLGKR